MVHKLLGMHKWSTRLRLNDVREGQSRINELVSRCFDELLRHQKRHPIIFF
jgi:hypothetical protein